MELIAILSGFLVLGSLLGLLIGFIQVLSKLEQTKKNGIQTLQFSVIGLIIGFSSCALLFN
ncbi:hypothetical protein [Flavobacterium sp.]|jgi:hypothetical protein|uniref:hypothetical protein n=1 Tax=Flavobacterium sp. TaxID=239 RepID=UPI0037BECD0F